MERLAAPTPQSRINLVLYYGVLAPRAAWRSLVAQFWASPGAAAETADGHLDAADCRHTRNYLWAELMRRSPGLDVLACPRCGGRLTLIALIEDPAVIVRVLRHLGLPTDIPEAQPARAPPLHLVDDAPQTEVAGDQILFDKPA